MIARSRIVRLPAAVSESCLQAGVEGARACRAERACVGERRAAIGEVRKRAGVEEGAIGRIAIVEKIVDATIDLERLVDLIRGVNVEARVGRQLRRLVG